MKWTEEDLQYLREHYPDDNTAEIAEHLGRTEGAVRSAADTYGIKKSAEFKERQMQDMINSPQSIAHRFAKGHKSSFKGEKWYELMPEESRNKCLRTTFKDGHIPHNAYADGTELVRDGRVYIKVPGIRRLQLKHRYVWEKHNGKIPEGYIIKFKDRDFMNCDIDNLYIMSRADACVKMTSEQSPEQIKKKMSIVQARRNELIRKDKMRIRWGLEPKTKLIKRYYAK
ncbi:MAG: HNH endonuclease [Prevotella sp.]|nr:HNH endonuclease [Prevotella sp.]